MNVELKQLPCMEFVYLDPRGLSHHLGDGAEVVERPLRRHARRAVGVREDAEVSRVVSCGIMICLLINFSVQNYEYLSII